MSSNLAAVFYLLASICFIMALRGLSSPDSARRGNMFGVVGMIIAISTTLAAPSVLSYGLIAIAILIGGAIGTIVAVRIQMTALPQLGVRGLRHIHTRTTRNKSQAGKAKTCHVGAEQ